ncbi:MAG: COG3400 family protein, partial [Campylobacteraceae bacterium]
MKKILIIADGILAKHFLERVVKMHSDNNEYSIVYYRRRTLPEKLPQSIKTYLFDPTSIEKLSSIVSKDFERIFIVVSKKLDLTASLENIRKVNKKTSVYIVDRWGLELKDKYLTTINSRDVISANLVDFLPGIPIIAKNVGLGIGEIIEVRVPVGSSYVYRHLGSIEQRRWRIAAIYRNDSLILPKPNTMIQPNDLLLTIGEPQVLQDVYKSIKQELGQFPLPFGSNIYCFIDMKTMDENRINTLLHDSMLLQERLNAKKLYIKIINPKDSNYLNKIKEYKRDFIDVLVDYHEFNAEQVFDKDKSSFDIGLCVVDKTFFESNAKMLYKTKIPIFKVGIWGIERLKRGIVIGINTEDSEKDSSVIFDLSTQLNLEVELYTFNPDKEDDKETIAEHFENIAKIYGKKVNIIQKSDKNPILEFTKQHDILQFIPFHQESLKSRILSLFSTDMNNLHFILNDK